MGQQRFRDLRVWNEAIDLARAIYRLSARLPAVERLALVTQLRRAAISVAANIAEGSVRRSRREFAHYLQISLAHSQRLKLIL